MARSQLYTLAKGSCSPVLRKDDRSTEISFNRSPLALEAGMACAGIIGTLAKKCVWFAAPVNRAIGGPTCETRPISSLALFITTLYGIGLHKASSVWLLLSTNRATGYSFGVPDAWGHCEKSVRLASLNTSRRLLSKKLSPVAKPRT